MSITGLASRLSIRMGIAFSVICFVSVGRVLFEILRTSDDGGGHRRTSYESFLFEFGAADGGGVDAASSGGRPGCRFAFDRNEFALRGTRLVGDLVNGSLTCAELRRPRSADVRTDDGVWQRLVSADGADDVAVYSAFYDDRPAVGVTPWIRIIGVAKLANRTHHCYVWYPNCDAPVVTPMVVNLTGRESGYTINRVRYVQYLFSCRLPGIEPIPTHVSVVGEPCAPTTIYLPVERPIRAEPDVDFGVCVAIAFGSVAAPVFAEWIEFGHLLGIAEFNVYDAGMTNMSAVFGHYARRRLLHVHRMPPPVPEMVISRATNRTAKASPPTYGSVKLASPASLNDCLLRNMYRYRFVVVIDFDEVIVPRLHDNYRQMLDHIDRKYRLRDRPYTYTFANTYYFLTFAQDPAQPAYMRTMRFRRRVPPSGHGLAPKSFVDPRSCLSVFNHYCLRPLRSPSTTLVHIHVSAEIARSHHYRMCGFSNKTCTEYFQQETQDDIALRFKSKLQPAVEAALRQIGT